MGLERGLESGGDYFGKYFVADRKEGVHMIWCSCEQKNQERRAIFYDFEKDRKPTTECFVLNNSECPGEGVAKEGIYIINKCRKAGRKGTVNCGVSK